MKFVVKDLPEGKEYEQGVGTIKFWAICFLAMVVFVSALSCMMQTTAAPVIIDGDTYGSWKDNFEDTSGIETWDNLELKGEDIELISIPIFYENFTGANGDPPDPAKWDNIDDGYTLEIENNQLKASVSPAPPTFKFQMVQTNQSFSMNHVVTWRQKLHTLPGTGMFYHFFVLNGGDDSRLFGNNQNHANEYHVYNYVTATGTQITWSVQGWHDFKVTFNSGVIEFYLDGVNEWGYDFGVTSVKYQFGTAPSGASSTIYTDDVFIGTYAKTGNLTSSEIILPNGKTWESLEVNKSESTGNYINVSVIDGVTFQPIPGFENLTGKTIDISGIDFVTHPTIRLLAHFSSDGLASPVLHGWNVTWFDTIPPATPTGLKVHDPFTGYSLILSWNLNTDPDLVNYILYYSMDNVTFTWLANISANTASYLHEGLILGTTYYYKIAAVDEVPNQSPFSEVVEGVPDLDMDNDGIGNRVDPDIDGDTVLNGDDAFPLNGNEWFDTDGDGIGNNADNDDDGDGYDDVNDAFPLNASEWLDSDNDGIGNNADMDDDNDGYNDTLEISESSDPLNPSSHPPDLDGDLIPDSADPDIDGDGYNNSVDDFDYDPNEWLDTDGDGIGNNADMDDDDDGYTDVMELNLGSDPLDDTSTPEDFDGDGIPDAVDIDDDNDGVPDNADPFPSNASEWLDSDDDGIGNNADTDDDNDGYNDTLEISESSDPLNPSSHPPDLDCDLIPDSADPDIDGDGYNNSVDDFDYDPNEWLDTDGDGIGNNADMDDDNDGFSDVMELNLGSDPLDDTSTPEDFDGDGIPDAVDIDNDNDGVPDIADPFPFDPTEWTDSDGDGIGNNADNDDDNDGYTDVVEIAEGSDPLNPGSIPPDNDRDFIPDSTDSDDDNDGVPDVDDDLPFNPNEVEDTDSDGKGNNIDTDDDNDGVPDAGDDFPLDDSEWNDLDGDGIGDNTDNDIDGDGHNNTIDDFDYNPNDWVDTDGDGIGDNADMDDDDDGYYDVVDDFPLDDTEWNDLDGDGIGDYTDNDIDGDGIINTVDVFPIDPTEWEDTDNDDVGDNKDIDLDGDGTINFNDAFPYNSEEWDDLDGDGIGDNSDLDKDGDGVLNENDAFPENANEWEDTDNNGIGNNADIDDDGDGHPDINDAFPFDDTEWSDLDEDGTGDNGDDDKDGDNVLNTADKFPTNKMEWKDSDNDGIGDNGDLDDDNDGHPDTNDDYPYDSSKWQKPNELLPFIYIMLILLVVLIVIGVILVAKMGKLGKSSALVSPEPHLRGYNKEEIKKEEPVTKEEELTQPSQNDLESEKLDEEMGDPQKRTEEQRFPPPPPSD